MENIFHNEFCSGYLAVWMSGGVLLFFAFMQCCLTYFLHHAMRPGQILGFYKRALDRFFEVDVDGKSTHFWYKPLGGCASCMNIWLALIGFWFVQGAIGLYPGGAFVFVWWLGYAVTANFWLSKLWH